MFTAPSAENKRDIRRIAPASMVWQCLDRGILRIRFGRCQGASAIRFERLGMQGRGEFSSDTAIADALAAIRK
ncbi:hypothetical protein [Sphingomonas sp.]|jgi:hypothetical protein|uniref:hypothetical protein n=1 Tax=Sphingomonas sp. TaxID=28214 RepID=UPI00356756E1